MMNPKFSEGQQVWVVAPAYVAGGEGRLRDRVFEESFVVEGTSYYKNNPIYWSRNAWYPESSLVESLFQHFCEEALNDN